MIRRLARTRALTLTAGSVLALSMLAACGSSDDGGGGGGDDVAVSLITKDSVNPFFVAMQEGAKEAADAEGVDLTIAAGKQDGDVSGQITAIENSIASGEQGILITPNGPGVNPAIEKARDAGLFVIALDTPPDPPETVDITFATDNFEAGELIGQWTAAQLGGETATIAMLDLFNDQIVSVDYSRDQGFLTGMGIDTADPQANGDEEPTGQYSGGEGGDYEIVCNEPTQGAQDGGRTAMENCLSRNPDINVVYTINEPSAYGADEALQAAGLAREDVLVVSVDGGCQAMTAIDDGIIDATSQQYPLVMAKDGVEAIKAIADGEEAPEPTDGLDFFNTGVSLITNVPADGVESEDAAAGAEKCWGEG
jgi:fructose transport system substrate-binding protein